LRVGKTEVDITKLWKDEQETDRPGAITVNLLQNGIVYDKYEVTKENDWKLTITDLPEYDEAGKAYKYTVTEHDVPGYESDVDVFEITNTRTDVKTIEITKSWLDDNSEDRPDSIKVELLRSITEGDKESVETYTVSADQEWTLKVKDLPAFDVDGKAYTYEIKEKPVKGYKTTIDGFDITNVRVGKTSVEGEKTWKDDDVQDRPTSIKVNLLQNGVVIDTQEVTADSDWIYRFTDLDKYDENGVMYEYTIKEQYVPGYKSEVNGYNITNVKSDKISIDITKGWEDNNSSNRPESITVYLMQNGKLFKEIEVLAKNNWQYKFTDLDAYDENGVAYEYTIEEKEVPGYETKIVGFDIINVLTETPMTKDPEQPSSEPKDKGDSVEVSGKTDSKNGDLPKTATNTFNMIVVGLAILIIGFSIYLYRRKTA
ncbi:LPXTG-motif cell wall-anchored protein, partial [Pseudogracilibacillus auburnensis]